MGDDREPLARLVHEQRVAKNAEKERPFFLTAWEDRTEDQKDLDRRIAYAVAAQAVEDAGLRNDRRDTQLLAFAAERDRAVAELKRRASRAVPGIVRDAWLGAVDVVMGPQQNQERSDEKESS